jgi:hypothetical protein
VFPDPLCARFHVTTGGPPGEPPRSCSTFFGRGLAFEPQQTSVSSLHCVSFLAPLYTVQDEGAIFNTGAIAHGDLLSPVCQNCVPNRPPVRAVDCGELARDV